MSATSDPASAAIPTRPDLSREFIVHHRRARFVAAAAEICHEFGLADVTASTLCQVAGSARNTFYDTFPNANACLLHGVEEANQRLFASLAEPPPGEWLPSLAVALAGLYETIAAELLLAELLLIHAHAIEGARERDPLATAVTAMRPLLARGREVGAGRGAEAPASSEEFLARVYLAAATEALRAGRADELPAQARELSLLAGDLFLGRAESERQLATV